ncbi:Signal transduction histidine-protein kinase/phosphatase DegS [Microbacterium sp. Bi128]|nr:Signal transduction histidine-protein kinase/phosphatase DegS [Microbacterium sp. Bi128]
MSLIAVQAGALQVSSADPDARRGAGIIRSLSVRTLDELRQMVGVLRAEGAPTPGDKPQPTLDDLPRLLSDSDLPADLVTDVRGELAPPLQRAVYRTVQEGLTNARKHAPGARVRVSVRTTTTAVDVVVHNDAPIAEALPLPSGGAGLRGLRERAELLGGRLDAGGEPDGGFRLAVTLPRREPER